MKRIILVETSDSTRERFQDALCGHGFNITAFKTPVDALVEISTQPPDLLISDIEMPGMNGLELAEAARERATGLPVILVTSDPDARERARSNTLGINHVLMKPVDEFAELQAAIQHELSWEEALDTVRTLDELRLEFFTDLSHQLRTPLTSVKLAIDGLVGHLRGTKTSSERDLADISRRNIERIVKLVENQLDMLQIMMGESRVSRRLVDLNQLIADINARLSTNEPVADMDAISADGGSRYGKAPSFGEQPAYVFTDPGPLAAVIYSLLSNGPSTAKRELRLSFDPASGRCCVDVGLEHPDCTCGRIARGRGGAGIRRSLLDFEYRAYQNLLRQLGGTIELEKSDNHKRGRISLPLYPKFDRQKDFLNPIRLLRAISEADGQRVSVLKCHLGDEDSFASFEDGYPQMGEFLSRIVSILSKGDLVLRGKHPRTIYLALTERSPHELDHIKAFLDEHAPSGLYVSNPLTIVPDQSVFVAFFDDLELV